MCVPSDDLRPTGSPQLATSAARWQRVLEDHLELSNPVVRHWTSQLRTDPHRSALPAKLAALATQGEDVERLLVIAIRSGPLPDDHAAAALQYRFEHPRRWAPVRSETVTPPSASIRHEHLRPPEHRPSRGPGIGF